MFIHSTEVAFFITLICVFIVVFLKLSSCFSGVPTPSPELAMWVVSKGMLVGIAHISPSLSDLIAQSLPSALCLSCTESQLLNKVSALLISLGCPSFFSLSISPSFYLWKFWPSSLLLLLHCFLSPSIQ